MKKNKIVCDVCGKQAMFVCGKCQYTPYCSRDHQLEHWRVHKDHCMTFKDVKKTKDQQAVDSKRKQLRLSYFEHYMHKLYDDCIIKARELHKLEKQHIKITKQILNELEYGISVCLLVRSHFNIKGNLEAVILLQEYLEEKMHFLEDLKDVYSIVQSAKYDQDSKQFSIRKASLLGVLINLASLIQLPNIIHLYHIYTDHITKIFGKESLEVSNCYFMVGTYYFCQVSYHKSIACFLKAAQIRGSKGGDCYYNLGIIFMLLNKDNIAVEMFKDASKLRILEYGQNSNETADTYNTLATIHESLGNYQQAIDNYEKLALVFSKNKKSDLYHNVKNNVMMLQKKMKEILQARQEKRLQMNKYSMNVENKDMIKMKNVRLPEGPKLQIPDAYLKKLNRLELYHLSELQLQLEICTTQFMVATTLGNSKFLKVLEHPKLNELKIYNPSIFQHISQEQLNNLQNGSYFDDIYS